MVFASRLVRHSNNMMGVLDVGRWLSLRSWSVFESTFCCLFFQYCLASTEIEHISRVITIRLHHDENGISNISPRRQQRRPNLHPTLRPRNRLLAHNPYHRPNPLRRHHRFLPPGPLRRRLPRLATTPTRQNRQAPRAEFQIHAAHLHDAQRGRQRLLETVQRVLGQRTRKSVLGAAESGGVDA